MTQAYLPASSPSWVKVVKSLTQSLTRSLAQSLMLPVLLSAGLWTLPAQAQTDEQVSALVEAFRLAAPDTGIENDGLYSAWQIKAENITGWSTFCKQPTDVLTFDQNFDIAQGIVICVVEDLLREEYGHSSTDREAIERSASWWMTGDSTRYLSDPNIADYTQTIWNLYLDKLASRSKG